MPENVLLSHEAPQLNFKDPSFIQFCSKMICGIYLEMHKSDLIKDSENMQQNVFSRFRVATDVKDDIKNCDIIDINDSEFFFL